MKCYVTLYLLTIITLISADDESVPIRRKHHEIQPNNCSISNVDARLGDPSKDHINNGVVKIFLPDGQTLSVCYPMDHYEHRQVAILSHVICRQLGFTTFTSRYKQTYPVGHVSHSLMPSSWQCVGHEQSVSQCTWENTKVIHCLNVLGIQCNSCFRILEGTDGIITNPGYPHAYVYGVLCEWVIIVPDGHTIQLTFLKFALPERRKMSPNCEPNESYIEITYGKQNSYTINRYCNFKQVKDVNLSVRKVRIRFFSGIYDGDVDYERKNYGISVAFQAIPEEAPSIQPLKAVMIATAVMLVFSCVALCCCCRRWGRRNNEQPHLVRVKPLPNAPGREELEAAYNFQRCNIQAPVEQHLSQAENDPTICDTNYRSSDSTYPQPTSLPPVRMGLREIRISQSATPRLPKFHRTRRIAQQPDNSIVSKIRTKLLARFSTSSNKSSNSSRVSDVSVFMPVAVGPSFQIYRSVTSETSDPFDTTPISNYPSAKVSDDSESEETETKTPNKTENKSADIPTIVLHLVDSNSVERVVVGMDDT